MYLLIGVIVLADLPSGDVIQAYYNGDGFFVTVTASEPSWQLFVSTDGDSSTGYEGFDIVIRKTAVETTARYAESATSAFPGGWGQAVGDTTIFVSGSDVTFFVPTPVRSLHYVFEGYANGKLLVYASDVSGQKFNGIINFCMADPHKTVPGECGCGRAEVFTCGLLDDLDTDGDIDLEDYQILQNTWSG